jgi:hypothetical protein
MPKLTLYDLIKWIRDYVGDPHHQPRLMADEFSWNQLCAAMDTIEDTDAAVDAYVRHDFPTDTGEKYLRIYGILQGLYLQQMPWLNSSTRSGPSEASAQWMF